MKNKEDLIKSIEEVKKYLFLTEQQPNKGEVFVKLEDFKAILSLYQNHIRSEVDKMKENLNGANPDHKVFDKEEFNEQQELFCRIGALTILDDVVKFIEKGGE